MMVLSSRTCILSSSIAAWLLTADSIFGFPSVLNRDGELARCPAIPKEDDMGEDATEEREAGPLLAAAMVPGLGGRDPLLSDTCEKGRWRGFRARNLWRDCLPVLVSQTFHLYPTSHLPLYPLIIYSLIHKPSMANLVQTDHTAQGLPAYILNFIFFLDKIVPDWFIYTKMQNCLPGPKNPERSKTFAWYLGP